MVLPKASSEDEMDIASTFKDEARAVKAVVKEDCIYLQYELNPIGAPSKIGALIISIAVDFCRIKVNVIICHLTSQITSGE